MKPLDPAVGEAFPPDISTTEIYLHTANQTGIGVRSPFDALGNG